VVKGLDLRSIFRSIFPLLILFCGFWSIYLATGSWRQTPYNAHVHQAWAFLHGHLALLDPPATFEVVRLGHSVHMAYGVVPSILMLPFVAIAGLSFHQAAFNAALGALAVTFWWSTLKRQGFEVGVRMWLTLCFGLGSLFWYYAGQNGNTWSLMHVTAVVCVMAVMHEGVGRRRGWVMGIGAGLAILARQAEVLALPFFLAMLWGPPDVPGATRDRFASFSWSLAVILGLGGLYNACRFGHPFDNGYERVIRATTDPGLLPHGLFHPSYVAGNVRGMFLKLPEAIAGFPWWSPTLDGFSVIIGTPALLLLPMARWRDRLTWVAGLTCLAMLALYLMYYWSGYAQFGRRYTVDLLPFAMWLVASACRDRLDRWLVGLTLAGILVEIWGITWWHVHHW
jgi:hypothetical protein